MVTVSTKIFLYRDARAWDAGRPTNPTARRRCLHDYWRSRRGVRALEKLNPDKDRQEALIIAPDTRRDSFAGPVGGEAATRHLAKRNGGLCLLIQYAVWAQFSAASPDRRDASGAGVAARRPDHLAGVRPAGCRWTEGRRLQAHVRRRRLADRFHETDRCNTRDLILRV
jgi:hypothetical protein